MHAYPITIAAVLMLTAPAAAQWLNYPTAGIPRTPDGKPNLSAPAPKTAAGNPDLSGLWQSASVYVGNIAKDLKPGDVPFQPWAEALYKHRRSTDSKDDPTASCIPGGVPRACSRRVALGIRESEPQLGVVPYHDIFAVRGDRGTTARIPTGPQGRR